jgi:gliding motility associated protien GldN
MQNLFKLTSLCLFVAFLGLSPVVSMAQTPGGINTSTPPPTNAEEEEETEATEEATIEEPTDGPVDDVVKKEIMFERKVLAYQPIRESDIFWQKRVWRVIDVREKMNLPFVYPEAPFFKLLSDAATKGELPVYSTDEDGAKFKKRMSTDDVQSQLSKTDTVVTFDPETYEEQSKIVRNDINWEDVKQFRVKEDWFFDKETSTLQVRILGIAPVIDQKDNEGNFRFQKPLFWVYYPQAREMFARNRAFTMGGNTNATISWEDMFEMRHFASYIIKESNVYDRKLDDYLQGVDLLMQSERIKNEIFNWEHDLWQY